MRLPVCPFEFPSQGLKRRGSHCSLRRRTEQSRELLNDRRIDAAMLFQAAIGASLELIEGPARFGDTDHRHVEMAALDHRLERRKNFLSRRGRQ